MKVGEVRFVESIGDYFIIDRIEWSRLNQEFIYFGYAIDVDYQVASFCYKSELSNEVFGKYPCFLTITNETK